VVITLLAWALWPSPYSKVRNLDSRGENIIAFGDSLTAGYGAAPGEDYPSHLSSILGRTIVNRGVSGDTTASALARIDDVLSDKPRIVLVGLGGNDFLQGIAISTTESNLRDIVGRIQNAGAMVVILGFRFPSINASYEKMYARIATDGGCLLVPDLLDGILSNPQLKSDEIHPNAAGYKLMAERLAAPCRKLIRKADAKRK
jgi:acyl-CoA thioesterase-1